MNAEPAPSARSRRLARRVPALLLGLSVFAIAWLSPVDDFDSDPRYALLAAQAIAQHGSLALDPYLAHPYIRGLRGDYRVRERGGSFYYYSLGTPLLSAPFVWLAGRAGYNMAVPHEDAAVQNLLSALTCAWIALVVQATARRYVGLGASLVIGATAVLGSPVASTGATGVWNSGYATLFLALALRQWAIRDCGEDSRLRLSWLVALLGAAFLCRPATALFGAGLLAYLACEPDRRFAAAAGVAAAAIALAIALAAAGAMDFLPAYYSPARVLPQADIGNGILRTLASPSRGLLVFTPALVPVLVAALAMAKRWRRRPVVIGIGVWLLVELLSLAGKANWWGGHSFGPRLWAQTAPGFALLAAIVWSEISQRARPALRAGFAATALAGTVASIAIHTGQGLFSHSARLWNLYPNIDLHPQLALRWRSAQWFATEGTLLRRMANSGGLVLARRAELAPARQHAPMSIGLLPPVAGGRAPFLPLFASVSPASPRPPSAATVLAFSVRAREPEVLRVYVGSAQVARLAIRAREAEHFRLPFDPALLAAGGEVVQFQLESARPRFRRRPYGLLLDYEGIVPGRGGAER